MKIKRLLVLLSAATLVVTGFSQMAAAQDDDDTAVISVRITTVKAGRGGEFRELQRQLAASRKNVEGAQRDMWQVVRGPTGTYQSVSFHDNFASLDKPFDSGMEPAEWARWLNRIGDTIVSARTVVLQWHGDLAIPADEGSERKMLMLRYRTVKAGMNSDYHDWIEGSLAPALKEGGVTGVGFGRVVAGDSNNMWISASRVDSYATLDGPGPFEGKSERQINSIMSDADAMVIDSRNELLRFQADMSY